MMVDETKLSRRLVVRASLAAACSAAIQREIISQDRAAVKAEPTRFQIACMTLPYSQYPLARALSGIKSAGFEFDALYTSHKEAGGGNGVPLMPPDGPLAKSKEIGQRCRDLGLAPLLMFSGIYPE